MQLWNLCEASVSQGHATALFCPPDAELLKHVNGGKVEVTVCPMRQDYDVVAAKKLAEAVRGFQPDIVHAHHPRAHAVALMASFFVPIPRLVVSRRVSFHLNRWNFFSQWKYRTSRIRQYVAVSDDIRRVLIAGGVPPGRVVTVPSGVDTRKYSPRRPSEPTRASLRLPADRPVVANLTHYSWWKGQAFFLEAAQRVLEAGVPAHFLLVGKDTDGTEAREKVRSLGIEPHVTLAGFRTDMPEILSFLSVSVVSSLAGEGLSGVLRESMGMGVPVVATRVGGNAELVEDEKTGLLVPPGNAIALADAIQRLLTDKALAQSCADSAQRFVRKNYSMENTIKKTVELYEKLLRG